MVALSYDGKYNWCKCLGVGVSDRQKEVFTVNERLIEGLLVTMPVCTSKHLMQGWLLEEVVGFAIRGPMLSGMVVAREWWFQKLTVDGVIVTGSYIHGGTAGLSVGDEVVSLSDR